MSGYFITASTVSNLRPVCQTKKSYNYFHLHIFHSNILKINGGGVIFIIKVFRIVVFIFIVVSTMFQPICSPAFFRCLSNSGTFTELQTTSFIETMGVACSDSVCHNRVQVSSIPVYYSPVVRIEPATFR